MTPYGDPSMRVRVLAAAVLVAVLTALLVGVPLTVLALSEDPATGHGA